MEEEELKPRARKRERKSKFGKKAETYQVAPISTVKIVKQGDIPVETKPEEAQPEPEKEEEEYDERMALAIANKRPKMMQFVKAGETKVTSGLENLEKDDTVNDVQEVTPVENPNGIDAAPGLDEENRTASGVRKENFQAMSKPMAAPTETNTIT